MQVQACNSRKIALFLVLCVSLIITCGKESTIQLRLPYDRVRLRIESVSPNSQYLFVNIYDMPESLTIYNIPQPRQVVVDRKHQIYWIPLDTLIYGDAARISWSEDSKKAVFSVFRRAREEIHLDFDFFPICVYDLETRHVQVFDKPTTPHRGLPQFYPEKHKIVFWTPSILSDTLEGLSPPWGHIFMLDTISKSLAEVRKGRDIGQAEWMRIFDRTSLYIATWDTLSTGILSTLLWVLDLSNGNLQRMLPDTRVISGIRSWNEIIVFNGVSTGDTMIYVYDLKKREIVTTVKFSRGIVMSAAINDSKLAIETIQDSDYWTYIVSMEGVVLDSVKGETPYWLVGSDSLVYSTGARIDLAFWLDNKREKKTIFEVVKKN